ncbi:MAG TPA: hypothetical protein VJ723_13040 [Candidatus Angelobacter sp.]|nr:hypothetical protein [Candidatus Angelobacter sp.]
MQRTKIRLYSTVILMVLMLSAPFTAQKKEKKEKEKNIATSPEVIWRDPGDVSSLNLLYGIGGKDHAPDPNGTYTFVSEDLEKTSPKFDIKDEQGVKWRVKLGQEPQSETAATRLLWAAGYFVDEDYYLASFKVTGLPKLKRGGEFVSPDGTVRDARLERKPKQVGKLGKWDWFKNPFLGQREFNGLRVMMALVNNWDLKNVNNTIRVVEGEPRYMVTDAGATFGSTGNSLTRSKSRPKDYVDSKFIAKSNGEFVDFEMHSRPFFLSVVNVPNYKERTKMEQVTKHIPRADAKWLGERLGKLSEEQISDCFRAAGYSPEEVTILTQTVQKRIAELNAL